MLKFNLRYIRQVIKEEFNEVMAEAKILQENNKIKEARKRAKKRLMRRPIAFEEIFSGEQIEKK